MKAAIKVLLAFSAVLLALLSCRVPPPDYPRIVIDTFSPNGSFTADTYIDLFGPAGDTNGGADPWADVAADQALAIAWADDGNPTWPLMARIDYTGGLSAGTYYIRVRGATKLESADAQYGIRVLALGTADSVPSSPNVTVYLHVADPYEVDDDLLPSGVPDNPASISLGDSNAQGHSLYRDGVNPDVDWYVLILP